MKPNRALPTPTLRLRERQCSIVTTNTPSNTSKSLPRRVIARSAPKPIRLPKLDHRRIRKRRIQRRLIAPRRFTRYGVPHAQIALEDDISRSLFFPAGAEEEHQATSLVLSRCGDVEACERAFVVGRDEGGLTGGEGVVRSLL